MFYFFPDHIISRYDLFFTKPTPSRHFMGFRAPCDVRHSHEFEVHVVQVQQLYHAVPCYYRTFSILVEKIHTNIHTNMHTYICTYILNQTGKKKGSRILKKKGTKHNGEKRSFSTWKMKGKELRNSDRQKIFT